MNQLPYDNLDELAGVLQTVFSGTNVTIPEANDILMNMAKDPTRFIDSMMRIITSEKSDQHVQKVKKAAAMVTLRILSPFVENKKSPTAEKQYILEAVIKGLYSPHVITTIKASLQQFLAVIYHEDPNGNFRQESIDLAKKKLAEGEFNDYAASLHIILAIIENPLNSLDLVSKWFMDLLEDLLNVGDNIIEGVGVEILDILKGENHEQKVVNVFMGLEILKVWTQIIFEFIQKLGKEEADKVTQPSYIELVVDKERVGRTLLKTLILQIPTEHQIKGCMFSTSGVRQLDQLLNTVKMLTVQCFEKILFFMVEAAKIQSKSKLLNAHYNKLYMLIQTDGFKAILQSLMHLCKANYSVLEKNLSDKPFQECVSQSLGILAKLTAFQELYTPFSDYKNMIIMDICLPLIASTKKDVDMFANDPQNFVNITSNLEEDQETSNVKLQAIQFLRKICENIDGAMSSLVMLVGMLIDFTLKSNDLSIIDEKYPKLTDYKDSVFIAGIEPRIRVETCLLVLASVNEYTQTRPDLMQIIDTVFTEYHEYFLGAELDPLIKSRMCLFLGAFVSSLFKRDENKELYAQHLRFLIECAGITSSQQQAVTEQANQTLYDMLAEKAHVLRMAPLIPDILERLISYTTTTQCITFFDVLHEIVRLYSSFISQNPELLQKVVADLVERGKAEYEFLINDKGLSKLTLTKIWNIIKIIGEKKDYLKYQDDIEKVLVPMFTFIIENEAQPFDEDLLGYISSTIKVAQRVSPVDWEIFRFIPTIFERYQNLITPIFPTLNNIIVYGREVIEENAEIKHTLVDIGIKAMNTTHPDAGQAAISLGAVLFQILIQYIGIPNEEWERMLVTCFEKLQNSDKSFLKARIGGVFLLAFLRNFEFTQACLIEHNALGIVLELFTSIDQVIVFDSHVYDRKIFLIALSKLLTQQNASPIIKERYPQILDILVSFLAYVQHIEHQRALEGNKRKIAPGHVTDSDDEEEKEGFSDRDVLRSLLDNNSTINPMEMRKNNDYYDDDSDEDEDEDDDDDEEGDEEAYFPTEKDEANHYVTHLVSDIKAQDEFTEFKNAITTLKQQDQQLLGRLAVTLPERKKTLMKEVLQSQRVVVNSESGEKKTQPRKMVRTVGRKVAAVNNQP